MFTAPQKNFLLFFLVIFTAIFWPRISTTGDHRLSDNQTKAVKSLINQYIMENPQIILKALKEMEQRDAEKRALDIKHKISLFKNKLHYDPNSPVGGNPNGNITVVEFFDYRCGYCKRVYPTIMKVIRKDGNIRYIYKELPILGSESLLTSKIALAVWLIEKEKYYKFHSLIMKSRGSLNKASLLKMAESLGIEKTLILKTVDSTKIQNIIKNNHKLAQSLNITGTPAFIIGEQLVPGAIDSSVLKDLIKKARGS